MCTQWNSGIRSCLQARLRLHIYFQVGLMPPDIPKNPHGTSEYHVDMWLYMSQKEFAYIYIYLYIYMYIILYVFLYWLIYLFYVYVIYFFFLLCICLCIYIYILEVTWIWLFKQQKYWIIMRSIYWGHLPTRSSVVV